MVTPETIPDDAINISQIMAELQITLNDQYTTDGFSLISA